MNRTDVLIIGCGIAGATTALRLARNPDRHITVVTRAPDPHESNTLYAQGGIVGRGLDDDSGILQADIIAAGAGVSFPKAAQILAEEGPPLLHQILEEIAHVAFDRDRSGQPLFTREAAHSRRRILHVGDATGKAIMDGLISALRDRPNVLSRIEHDGGRPNHLSPSFSRSAGKLPGHHLSRRLHV